MEHAVVDIGSKVSLVLACPSWSQINCHSSRYYISVPERKWVEWEDITTLILTFRRTNASTYNQVSDSGSYGHS